MKIQEAICFVNEDVIDKETFKGKDDIARFAVSIKQKIMSKGFQPEQAQKIIAKLLNDLNKTGWFEVAPEQLSIAIDGSNVMFTAVYGTSGKRQTFTYSGVDNNGGEYKAPTNVSANPNAQAVYPTDSFQRYGNLKNKVPQ